MPTTTATQYLQVPKFLPNKKARSRSRSRSPMEVQAEVSSPTQVVVSPQKLSFRASSPPTPFRAEPYHKPSSNTIYTNRVASYSTPYLLASPVQTSPMERKDSLMSDFRPSYVGSNVNDLNEGLYAREPTPTPPPEKSLRQKLIGAWKLESYVAYPTPNSSNQRPTYPMTKNVTGYIMYTPDGYMSAQMLIPGQQSFKRGEGEEPQWAEAGKRCFAYCGPYYITNEGHGREEILRHTFQCCSLPGWIGDIQVRTHRFEEDEKVLVLGSEEPTEVKGDKRVPVLKWRRAINNENGHPPPPMPQIKVSGPGEP
ncbi:Putative Lipocalin-like domain-containing protein [Septoria linicola]|uniref:Lipocalin-like domain-containing protein n=1 Tax=Septoria linicola TaxID=215465 RepID=A0A9Q9B1P1_9PEZI|nr:putative Lipocalin-like domain-containing protein [Septoria linicola]USW55948.1 Putative Lipocalin-like domain-containing protein [Septoria linicola]